MSARCFTRRGTQRWRCKDCGVTFVLPEENHKRGFYIDPEKLKLGIELAKSGRSQRDIVKMLGVSNNTAKAIRKHVGVSYCECGQMAGHRGWCKVRYARSPKRQAMMGAMHKKQTGKGRAE